MDRQRRAWQQWRFVDSGAGWYRLRSRRSGKVLDVAGNSTANGIAIRQWSDANATNQQFRLADYPYFRSWTSSSLTGTWTSLAATESNLFAGKSNCRMKYVYQGRRPSFSGEYGWLPYRLGLLTQTNSTC